MNFSSFEFIMYSLAVFRITRLIVFDQITEWMRRPFMIEYVEKNEEGEEEMYVAPKEGGFSGWLGSLLSCYWCTGIWVATALFILHLIDSQISLILMTVFAAAGVAALLETFIQKSN